MPGILRPVPNSQGMHHDPTHRDVERERRHGRGEAGEHRAIEKMLPYYLRGRIPGLLRLEVGVDASRIDYACDVVLYSEFESWKALDAYARHPEHLQVRDELAGIRIARHQVDYEVHTD
jgi:hypothetical protein